MIPAQRTSNGSSSYAKPLSWILLGLFACQSIVVGIKICLEGVGAALWPEGLLVLLAAATTAMNLSGELPWQNILMASVIIASISSAIHALATAFGQFPLFAQVGVFWPVPLVWLTAILNARGLARLTLVRSRASPNYGLWLVGLTMLLVMLFGFGSQYFEKAGRESEGVQTILWLDPLLGIRLLEAGATSVLALLVATPFLINKRPIECPVDRQPMIIWLLLNSMFVIAAFCQGAWPAAVIIVVGNLLVLSLVLAVR